MLNCDRFPKSLSFNSNIGFDEGVILSTGGLEMVTDGFGIGSGISGDSDLELALNQINLTWNKKL